MQMMAKGTDARTILSVMAFATGIAVIGHTVEPTKSTKLSPSVGDAQILLGGTAATVILVLLAQAGDVGASFSKGIAVIALLSSLGYYGIPVFGALGSITGQSKPTTPTKIAPKKAG
jgi:hypothetical protein